MGNDCVLNHQGVDISHQESWQAITTDTLPEGISSIQLTLLELLHRAEKPDVLLPLPDLLDASGAQAVGLVKELYALIKQHSRRTGLWVTADTDTHALIALSELLLEQALIVIHVPKFADGRHFSFAQTLRQIGYQGDIRVTGAFGRDQIAYLLRVGVDSFVVSEHDLSSDFSMTQAFTALASSYDGRNAAALPMFAGV